MSEVANTTARLVGASGQLTTEGLRLLKDYERRLEEASAAIAALDERITVLETP